MHVLSIINPRGPIFIPLILTKCTGCSLSTSIVKTFNSLDSMYSGVMVSTWLWESRRARHSSPSRVTQATFLGPSHLPKVSGLMKGAILHLAINQFSWAERLGLPSFPTPGNHLHSNCRILPIMRVPGEVRGFITDKTSLLCLLVVLHCLSHTDWYPGKDSPKSRWTPFSSSCSPVYVWTSVLSSSQTSVTLVETPWAGTFFN